MDFLHKIWECGETESQVLDSAFASKEFLCKTFSDFRGQ